MNEKPNILLIFTDMQRADTIHALGNPIIKTPNLDRLVREGTAFTNCQSPSPVCVPARCCMHYGLYPQKTGLFTNGRMMDDNGQSFPQLLGNAGYKTHSIGKCHFTPDHKALRGFQSREIQEECTSSPEEDDYVKWLEEDDRDYYEPHGARGEMYYTPQISSHPISAHPSNWIGDRTIEFLENTAQSTQPWMLFSSFIHPHPPFAPPKPWHKLYRSPMMPLPLVPPDNDSLQTWVNRKQNRYKYRDQGIDNQMVRLMKAYYYATISFVDFQIGRILDKLEKGGQLDNTLIIFTSDHGEYLGDYNCFGKRSMHDVSSRVPLIVRHPKHFEADKRCDSPASLVDIMPTVAKATNLDLSQVDHDGEDLAQIARNESSRTAVFSQYDNGPNGIYMIVEKEWKYFYSAADDREFLFNRQNDPRETRNIAGLSFVLDDKNRLKKSLLSYLRDFGAEDAIVVSNDELDWRKHPKIDESYLKDPDSGLILQDHPSFELDVPGYTD